MPDVRSHITFANVTSFTALFVALSGGAYAAITIRPSSITSTELASNSVGRAELRANSVGSAELRDAAVGGKQIQNDSISTANLSPEARQALGLGPKGIGFDIAAFNQELADLRAKSDAARAEAEAAKGAADGAKGTAEAAQTAAGGAQTTADGAKATAQAAGGAIAYAHVNGNGTLDAANSKNVVAGTEDPPLSGLYCLKLTGGVAAKNVTATIDIGGADSRDSVGVTLAPTAVDLRCAATDSAVIGTADWSSNAFADRPFYIVFH